MKSENKEKYRNNRNMQIQSEKIKWQNDVKFTIPSSLKQRKVDRNEMRNLGVQGTFHQGDTRFG